VLHQQTVDRQAVLMRKGAKGVDDLRGFHIAYDITGSVEMSTQMASCRGAV
jgi:hypothetical protein